MCYHKTSISEQRAFHETWQRKNINFLLFITVNIGVYMICSCAFWWCFAKFIFRLLYLCLIFLIRRLFVTKAIRTFICIWLMTIWIITRVWYSFCARVRVIFWGFEYTKYMMSYIPSYYKQKYKSFLFGKTMIIIYRQI